jgi:hypothetical protein
MTDRHDCLSSAYCLYFAAFLLFPNVENNSCACNDQSRCVPFGPIVSDLIFDGQVLTWGCGAKGQLGYGMERALLQTSNM